MLNPIFWYTIQVHKHPVTIVGGAQLQNQNSLFPENRKSVESYERVQIKIVRNLLNAVYSVNHGSNRLYAIEETRKQPKQIQKSYILPKELISGN